MAELIEVSKLIPHPRNEEFFDDMSGPIWSEFLESVRINGVQQAITLTKDNIIVSGHQRVRACKELSIERIPYITHEYKATDIMTEDDAVLLALIDTNLKQRSGGNPNPVKLAICFRELERINGIRQGSAGNKGTQRHIKSSDGNNFSGKTQTSIADEYGISERQYRNIIKLCDVIPELKAMVESKSIPPTTVCIVWAKYFIKEQAAFYKALGEKRVSSMSGEETKTELKRLRSEMKKANSESATVAVNQEFQRQLDEKDNEIKQLLNHKPEKIEVTPDDYVAIKEMNAKFSEKIKFLQSQIESINESSQINSDTVTTPGKNPESFTVSCTIEDLPYDGIDTSDERDRLLCDNPNMLLSQIPSVHPPRRMAYRILERALGLTNEGNNLLGSWDDYVRFICEYDGSNYPKLKARIQKYNAKKD